MLYLNLRIFYKYYIFILCYVYGTRASTYCCMSDKSNMQDVLASNSHVHVYLYTLYPLHLVLSHLCNTFTPTTCLLTRYTFILNIVIPSTTPSHLNIRLGPFLMKVYYTLSSYQLSRKKQKINNSWGVREHLGTYTGTQNGSKLEI
jgi:hypothetical protein